MKAEHVIIWQNQPNARWPGRIEQSSERPGSVASAPGLADWLESTWAILRAV